MTILLSSLIVILVFGVTPGFVEANMTLEQVRQYADSVRAICQPKFKVTDELVDGIKVGLYPDHRELKCYVNCVLELMKSIKRGKLNYESTMKVIRTTVPEDKICAYTTTIDACRNIGKNIKDRCDFAYEIVQCFLRYNPTFIFP